MYETPIVLRPNHTIQDALALIHKRAHGAVMVVDDGDHLVGIFTEQDGAGFDRFTQLHQVMAQDVLSFEAGTGLAEVYEQLNHQRLSTAPVVEGGRLVGAITRKGALRSTLYSPALDADGRLRVAVAIGITGDAAAKAEAVVAHGADVIVVDTAHGHQDRMIEAVREVRKAAPDIIGGGRQRGDRRRDRGADRGRRRHREGGRRPRGDVHHPDDDRRRTAAVQRGGGVRSGRSEPRAPRVGRRRRAPPARRGAGLGGRARRT